MLSDHSRLDLPPDPGNLSVHPAVCTPSKLVFKLWHEIRITLSPSDVGNGQSGLIRIPIPPGLVPRIVKLASLFSPSFQR